MLGLPNRGIVMNLRFVVVALVCAVFGVGTLNVLGASREDRGPVGGPSALDSATLPFKLLEPCFSGRFADYDTWADYVIEKGHISDLQTFEQRFPRSDYDRYRSGLECHYITYPVGALDVRGIYIRPRFATGETPVLIANRGGNGSFGAWVPVNLFNRAFPLAMGGFAILASQYRGSQEGVSAEIQGVDEFGGEDVEDVLALVDLGEELPGADAERLGMVGWSRGGMMTYMAAARTDKLRAVAVIAAPTDLEAELERFPQIERVFRARIPGYEENKAAVLASRSVLNWVDEISPGLPILVIHGEKDKRVSVNSARSIAQALESRAWPHKLTLYEHGSHQLFNERHQVTKELVDWFNTHL